MRWQFLKWDTGEVLAEHHAAAEVSRAFGELVKIGAPLREECGRHMVYRINPEVGVA